MLLCSAAQPHQAFSTSILSCGKGRTHARARPTVWSLGWGREEGRRPFPNTHPVIHATYGGCWVRARREGPTSHLRLVFARSFVSCKLAHAARRSKTDLPTTWLASLPTYCTTASVARHSVGGDKEGVYGNRASDERIVSTRLCMPGHVNSYKNASHLRHGSYPIPLLRPYGGGGSCHTATGSTLCVCFFSVRPRVVQ